MKDQKLSVNHLTFRRLVGVVAMFLKSPVGGRAKLLLAGLLLLMLCINGMNVANSYVGRDFMSAIEHRDTGGFIMYAWMYAAVFGVSTLVAVFFRFAEERLGLLWRDWLTHHVVSRYIDLRIYLHLEAVGGITNPDQRMSEDIKQLTTSTLSFLLMIINGTVTAISFSGVLWAISPTLFIAAVLYAAVGSALTILLGRPHPFKALVAHAAVYNWYTQIGSDYGFTQSRFPEFWEDPSTMAQSSPHLGAGNFVTPTLVIHGQQDFRVPLNHGIELYHTLKKRGVPSKLIYYPNENHWVLKPQNSIFWYQQVIEWIEKYAKPGPL